MSGDGLSDLNGILYMFRDPIAIKGPFPGGNVDQEQWKLTILTIFCPKVIICSRNNHAI